MADASPLAKLRSLIGKESAHPRREVEKGAIKRFVDALGDTNPLFTDEEAARKGRYGGIVAPPTFLLTFGRVRRPTTDPGVGRGSVNAGNEIEFLRPVRPGDVISMTSKLVDVQEKAGRLGPMFVKVTEHTYMNQKGEKVGVARQTQIVLSAGGKTGHG